MSDSWGKYPFVRFFVFFALGIAISDFATLDYYTIGGVVLSLVVIYIGLLIKEGIIHYSYRNTFLGVIGLLLILFLGLSHSKIYNTVSSDNFAKIADIKYYHAVVTSDPFTRNGFLRFEAEVSKAMSESAWISSEGQVRIFIKNPHSKRLQYGDQIFVRGTPSTKSKTHNPGEVDYGKILLRRKIYGNHFLNNNQYHIIQKANFSIVGSAYSLRHWCDSILSKRIVSKANYEIASGLILGLAANIDQEMQKAYSRTGVIHVLAVSGMHVVLIFSLLSIAFSGFNYIKYGDRISALAMIFLLFCYAYLTGFSPSVVRAVVMFSFVLAGKSFRRDSSGINILAVSAFLMLLHNPNYLFEISFQLSFFAVLGIIVINPIIIELYVPSNRAVEYIWNTISMSIAATILTFPLTLYYFHQFPWFFIPVNLFVIPLSSIILYLSFPLILFNKIPLLGFWLGKIVSFLIWLMNSSVAMVNKIPGILIENIDLSFVQVVVLYVGTMSILIFCYKKNFKYFVSAFSCVIFFTVILTVEKISAHKQSFLGVYFAPKESIYSVVSGDNAHVYASEISSKTQQFLGLHLLQKKVRHTTFIDLKSLPNPNSLNEDFLIVKNKIAVIGNCSFLMGKYLKAKIQVDFLIANRQNYKDFEKLIECFKPRLIILDSSLRPYQAKKLGEELSSKNFKFLDISKTGGHLFPL